MPTVLLEKLGMMHIDVLRDAYIEQVFEIEKLCFSNPWSKEDLAAQLDNENAYFLVAIDGEKVAGYMGLQIFSGEGYVTNVAVLPQYRGQGIAKSLIAEQMKNEMEFITLEVRESNIPAISLYTKMGFENVGVRPKFYSNPTENAIIMTKVF